MEPIQLVCAVASWAEIRHFPLRPSWRETKPPPRGTRHRAAAMRCSSSGASVCLFRDGDSVRASAKQSPASPAQRRTCRPRSTSNPCRAAWHRPQPETKCAKESCAIRIGRLKSSSTGTDKSKPSWTQDRHDHRFSWLRASCLASACSKSCLAKRSLE